MSFKSMSSAGSSAQISIGGWLVSPDIGLGFGLGCSSSLLSLQNEMIF